MKWRRNAFRLISTLVLFYSAQVLAQTGALSLEG